MSTEEEENYAKTPLIIAIASLVLAIIALAVAVVLAVPFLRKSYSSTPATPVIPVVPSHTQYLPPSLLTTNPNPRLISTEGEQKYSNLALLGSPLEKNY